MEKVNLFETKKTGNKIKQGKNVDAPNSSLDLKYINTTKVSIKPKTHIDLNYVKQDRVLNFYKLKGTDSKITCHGRPTPKQVKSMRQIYKVNYCLTLQKQKENPLDVLKYCQDNNIEWQLIELDGANIAYMKKKEVLLRIVDGLYIVCQKLLTENINLFIHCAAGLHRTGTILYSILRIFGETPESAFSAIGIIREDTQREVGKERIKIAENVIYPELLRRFKENKNIFPNNFMDLNKDQNNNIYDFGNVIKEYDAIINNIEKENRKLNDDNELENNKKIILEKKIIFSDDNKSDKFLKNNHKNSDQVEKVNYENKNINILDTNFSEKEHLMKNIFNDLDC